MSLLLVKHVVATVPVLIFPPSVGAVSVHHSMRLIMVA
jgi:hypothetical protein